MKIIRVITLALLLGAITLCCDSAFDLVPPRGGWIWVAFDNDTSNRMYILDPTTGIAKKRLPGCGVGGEIGDEAQYGHMAWGAGKLWATGVRGEYEPYWCEIEQETGAVIEYFDAPSGSVGGGVTWDGSSLWFTDMYDFYTINPTDNYYEWQFDTGWHGDKDTYHSNRGLTWDGDYLWSVGSQAYESNDVYLYQFDIEKGVEVRRVKLNYLTPQDGPDGLTYDGEAFWLTTKKSSRIYRISPVDGSSLGYIVPRTVSPTGEETIIDKPFAVAFEFPSE